MIFRNQTDHGLSFVIASVRYDVPVSGTAEIPDAVAYCVKAHGLPLAEVVETSEPTMVVEDVEASPETPRRSKKN